MTTYMFWTIYAFVFDQQTIAIICVHALSCKTQYEVQLPTPQKKPTKKAFPLTMTSILGPPLGPDITLRYDKSKLCDMIRKVTTCIVA